MHPPLMAELAMFRNVLESRIELPSHEVDWLNAATSQNVIAG